MKKLTTGIFTVVLGLVAADASAAVTSKAYVDAKVKGVSDDLTSLSGTVAGKADQATTLAGYGITDAYTTTAADAAFANKATQTKVGTAELTTTAKDLSAAVNELNTNKVTAAQVNTAIKTAISDTENGAIAGAIADALGDYTTTTDMDAKLNLKADKTDTYTKTEVDTAVADAKKAGTDAASALTAYQTTNNAAVQKNASDITALDTAYKAADTAINAKIGTVAEGKTVVEMITEAAAGAKYDDAAVKADIKKNADAISAMDTAYKAADTALTTAVEKAQSDATKGITDAAAAQATANAAIPAPTDECANPANKCVLTYNNSAYAWEVIEREGGQ